MLEAEERLQRLVGVDEVQDVVADLGVSTNHLPGDRVAIAQLERCRQCPGLVHVGMGPEPPQTEAVAPVLGVELVDVYEGVGDVDGDGAGEGAV